MNLNNSSLSWNFWEGKLILAIISSLDELTKNHTIDPVYIAFLFKAFKISIEINRVTKVEMIF